MQSAESLRRSIKIWIVIFIISLIVSGVTAFALETELEWLNHLLENKKSSLAFFIKKIYVALHLTNLNYPYLAYDISISSYCRAYKRHPILLAVN